MHETKIDRRYDPENDCRPNGPRVTWAEYDLQQQVTRLESRIAKLEAVIEKIHAQPATD